MWRPGRGGVEPSFFRIPLWPVVKGAPDSCDVDYGLRLTMSRPLEAVGGFS